MTRFIRIAFEFAVCAAIVAGFWIYFWNAA